MKMLRVSTVNLPVGKTGLFIIMQYPLVGILEGNRLE